MKWTIRRKFLLGFFVLFTFAAIIVNQVMKVSLEENSMDTIQNEQTKLQHTSREHIKNFAQLNPPKGDLLREHSSTIAQELSDLYGQSVALFDKNGDFLYEAIPIDQPLLTENQTYQTNLTENSNEELKNAFQNKASFTLFKVPNGNLVYFAYPLYIHDQFYGVLRFTGDYTELFNNNRKVLQSFSILTVSLFVGVFIISFLLIHQMIKPLSRLTKATRKMANGDYSVDVYSKTGDEIEELTLSFNEMKKKIKEHIEVIEEEKNKIIALEKSKTSFFNNVTHELKTPLATISGYAQIIGEENFNDTEFLKKAATKIRLESDRLNEMVIELLEMSKSQANIAFKKMETMNLFPLLTSICEDMNLKAQRHQMEIILSINDFFIKGNKEEMRKVFINILDNAIKYGITGSKIFVSMNQETIKVVNETEPIDDQIVEHAFEPFVHTKRRGSSGLGLYISKQIIQQHSGTITFQYENKKAIVSIYLPHWQQNGNN